MPGDKDDKDKGGEGDDKPKPLTAEDVQAIVSKTVNRTVTDHLKRTFEGESFTTKMGEIVKAALQATKDETTDDEAAGGAGDKARGGDGKFAGKLPPEVEARIKAAEKRAEKAEKLAQDEADLRKKTVLEKEQLDDRGALGAAFKARGVRDELVEAAVALHYGKTAARGEDGKLRWREGDDELEVAAGVEKWTKTPAGMAFLPPRQAAGSGNTGGGRTPAGAGTASGSASDADIGAWLSAPRT